MYCTKCGFFNDNIQPRCVRCDAQLRVLTDTTSNAKSTKRNGIMRRLFKVGSVVCALVVLILALCVFPPATAWQQTENFVVTVNSGTFSSPESAVEFCINAMTELNIEEALSACSINEYAEGYNAEAMFAQYNKIYSSAPAPNQYEFYQSINQAKRLGDFAMQMKWFIYSFTESEAVKTMLDGKLYELEEPAREASEFVKSVDPSIINDLTIVSIDIPNPDIFYSDDNVKKYQKTADNNRADEMTERVVLYELNGAYYYSGFQLARYGETWKITGLVSFVGDCTAYGSAKTITREEYEELVS